MGISGPVLVMVLEKENAVADWRDLIGPTDAHKAKVTHPHRYVLSLIFFVIVPFFPVFLIILHYKCMIHCQFLL